MLVATTAHDPRGQSFPQAARLASSFIASPVVTRSMRSANGHRFVRGAFGADPLHSHWMLTRDLFAGCDPSVRGGWLAAMTEMNLLEGIAGMEVPTTVMVGSRDTLTVPAEAADRSRRPFRGALDHPARTVGTCCRWRTPTR